MTSDCTPAEPIAPRKAYSYLRFSTPEQSKGDSFRRQYDEAVAYAERHGLDLDRDLTFQDLGKSAYRSANATTGRLGDFLEAVDSGQVPQGSYLLVESLDRISRDHAFLAQQLLSTLITKGVTVVTLKSGREYSLEVVQRDPTALIYAILEFMRSNEESATKSKRLRASWENKRANIGNGKPLTGRVPAWLRLSDDRSELEVIEDRAAVVQRIFRMALDGVGQHSIAAALNADGIAPWGKAALWHRSYVSKVLSNPAVIGTFTPHVVEFDGAKKRRKALEPVTAYFPAIVSEDDYREAQALRQALGAPQRGRHAHAPITNILAGLAACPVCGARMTRVNKGPRSRPAFVCTKAKVGAGCGYRAVPYQQVEDALFDRLAERLVALEGVEAGGSLEAEVRGAEEQVDRLKTMLSNLLDNLAQEESRALRRRLRDKEGQLEEAERNLQDLKERQEASTGLTVAARIKRAVEALQAPSGERSVAEANLALRSIFKRAVINWTGGWASLEWTHGGTCDVPYTTGFSKVSGPGWRWEEQEGGS